MNPQMSVMKRRIPSTGELLPVIGLGTWQTFDVGQDESSRTGLKEVLQALVEHGGSVIDSSPMYGTSESVVGELSSSIGINNKLFIATKVWTTGEENGIQQMQNSFSLLKRSKIELMQVHNLTDWRTHLPVLRKWKEEGRIKYIGITHYTESAYNQVEDILKKEPLDFLQINYSIVSRKVEEKLLPLAQEKKVGVLVNRPFEEGALFSKVKNLKLPDWSRDFDCESWGQFFLKFILSNPAVTCVMPGTSKRTHMLDNLKAGSGQLPNQDQRSKMMQLFQ